MTLSFLHRSLVTIYKRKNLAGIENPVLYELVPEQGGSRMHFSSKEELLYTIKPPKFTADAMKVINYCEDCA